MPCLLATLQLSNQRQVEHAVGIEGIRVQLDIGQRPFRRGNAGLPVDIDQRAVSEHPVVLLSRSGRGPACDQGSQAGTPRCEMGCRAGILHHQAHDGHPCQVQWRERWRGKAAFRGGKGNRGQDELEGKQKPAENRERSQTDALSQLTCVTLRTHMLFLPYTGSASCYRPSWPLNRCSIARAA